jgi:ATP-dependent RNA circularization protein (DNA/RNA ligase family)
MRLPPSKLLQTRASDEKFHQQERMAHQKRNRRCSDGRGLLESMFWLIAESERGHRITFWYQIPINAVFASMRLTACH